MAMSNCKECGKAVSTLAKTCPSCGVPKPAKIAKRKTSTKKTITKVKKINKNKEGIWAHCRNYQCRDYTQMYKIPLSYLDFEKCKLCDSMFMETKTVNGEPLMPSDGIYDKIQNRIEKSHDKTENLNTTQTKSGEANVFDKFADGNLDLATAFWGFGVFGSMIVGVVCGVLSEAVGTFFNFVYFIVTFLIIRFLWGCAENHKKIMTQKKQSSVWGGLTQAFCVFSGLGLVGFVFELF